METKPLVDNFEEFRNYLNFPNNSFYFCQLIQRSKDSNIVTSSNNRYRRVKSFYISSLEEYDRFTPEIKEFCKNNNARAYIRINPVSFYEVALNTAMEYMRRIKECQTFKSCNIYDSYCENNEFADVLSCVFGAKPRLIGIFETMSKGPTKTDNYRNSMKSLGYLFENEVKDRKDVSESMGEGRETDRYEYQDVAKEMLGRIKKMEG